MLDGKWTKKPLPYLNSNNFHLCVSSRYDISVDFVLIILMLQSFIQSVHEIISSNHLSSYVKTDNFIYPLDISGSCSFTNAISYPRILLTSLCLKQMLLSISS